MIMKSKEVKKQEAIKRNEAYSKLSVQQKLDRLGSTGSAKQRAKLTLKLESNV